MKLLRKTSPLLLLLMLAALGALLVYLPAELVRQYELVSKLGQPWITVYWVSVGLGGALLVGVFATVAWRLWRNTRRKRRLEESRSKNPSQLSLAQRAEEVRANLSAVEELGRDPHVPAEVREQLRPLAREIEQKQANQTLEIVAFGTVSSGKSSLLNALAGRDLFATDLRGGTTIRRNEIPWPGADKVTLVDTPGLAEVGGHDRAAVSAAAAKDADLVLVVVDGPLRESEFELLKRLGQMEKRAVVCLNKGDWFSDADREKLLGQIAGQVREFVAPADVVAVRALPVQRSRVRVLADGGEVQEQVEVPADIAPLAERMGDIVQRDGRDLLLANLLLRSRGLVDEARQKVRQTLDRRAWQIVDRYMWGAGGAAAISPFPVVDLAAGCAISTKMVLDLARVYHQDVDTEVAVNLLGQLGKNLLAVLGASVATPAVVSVVASLLKTVPGAGTIAGGALQGLVLALVTRWIGAVFIEYFKHEMQPPEGGLAELARRQWQQLIRVDELRKFLASAREHLQDDQDS